MPEYHGFPMSQAYEDLETWRAFFAAYPVKAMIELGSGNGGMSLFFAERCHEHGVAEFHTFDNQRFCDPAFNSPYARGLNINFHWVDLWDDGIGQVLAILARDELHPLMLFCDNGDKPREWRTFGPYLREGDYIAVHDWPYEFGAGDIGSMPVVEIMQEQLAPKSITRWFKVTEAGGPT